MRIDTYQLYYKTDKKLYELEVVYYCMSFVTNDEVLHRKLLWKQTKHCPLQMSGVFLLTYNCQSIKTMYEDPTLFDGRCEYRMQYLFSLDVIAVNA